MAQGVVVAADQNISWLLPWWWGLYSRHNSYPVAFVDFGLSQKTAGWCKERGDLIPLKIDHPFVTPQSKIDPKLAQEWQKLYGHKVWQAREAWFKKPLAMLLSPYETTIWMDLDCEVCSSLAPIFDFLDPSSEIALSLDPGRPGIYNSGVVLFRKKTILLADWANRCMTENEQLIGDDYIVSKLIATESYRFKMLPQEYNWQAGQGLNFSALILHWAAWGKIFIETHGGMQGAMEMLV